MGYATAGEVIGRAATQCGVLSLSPSQIAAFDPWASSEPNVLMLIDLLRTLGGDIAKRVKAGRIKEATITTADSATSYDVPADYAGMLDGTAWDRTGTRPLYGPVTPQFSQWFKAWNGGTGAYIPFRIQGRRIEFPVAPANALSLRYEYMSSYWVQSDGAPAPDKANPTVRTDTVLFDDELVVLGLKLYWKHSRGYDTSVEAQKFKEDLADAVGEAAGGATLSLNGPGYGERFVDERNFPVTGWGTT